MHSGEEMSEGRISLFDPAEQARADTLITDPRSNDQLVFDTIIDILHAGALADPATVFGVGQPAVRLIITAEQADTPHAPAQQQMEDHPAQHHLHPDPTTRHRPHPRPHPAPIQITAAVPAHHRHPHSHRHSHGHDAGTREVNKAPAEAQRPGSAANATQLRRHKDGATSR